MAKLYYKYGTMGSSKTANLLMVAYNYKSQDKRIVCIKSSLDNRWGTGVIKSRAGVPDRECLVTTEETDLFYLIEFDINTNGELHCILVDEAQFLRKEQIKQLARVVDELKVPVMCYGLKNSYIDGELFEGSAALLYYADSIEEIKTVCQYCNRKATMHLRMVDGKPVRTGESAIKVGDTVKDNDYYIQTCRYHYFNPEN